MTAVVVLMGLAGIAALAAAVPHVLPWPQRLRWLIATNSMADPFGGLAPDLFLEEVSVQSTVCSTSTTVWLTPPARRALPRVLSLSTVTISDRTWLDRWAVARTPLLLMTTANGEVTLRGPSRCVVGLRALDDVPVHPFLPDRARRWMDGLPEPDA